MDNVVEKAMGLAMTFVVLCMASGHRDWVWKGVVYNGHCGREHAWGFHRCIDPCTGRYGTPSRSARKESGGLALI